MIRRTFFSLAAVAVSCLALGQDAKAAQILGSMSLNGGVTQLSAGSNLGNTTTLNFTAAGPDTVTVNFGGALGDFAVAGVPNFTVYTSNTLNLANLAGFTLTNGTYGTFTSVLSSGPYTSQVVSQTAQFADIFLVGTYTGLPGFEPTVTSLRISLNQSAGSVSAAITLNSPPVPPTVVPEPSTIASLGVALLGLAGLRRFRRRSA
jgi:hypothetical protein